MAKQIEQMITEQVLTWARQQADAARTGERSGAWPIITISREFGAHGAALATLLGRRIGFSVWDKDLLRVVAEKIGGDERLLQSLDEHRRKAIDDALRGALMGSRHTNTQYFRALMRVIHTIAAHGKSIIVGRGAHYICKDDAILRVRVVCPLEQRVRDYARRHQVSEREARREVMQRDADRADFLKYHFSRDGAHPYDYDLTVNSGTYTLEQLVDIVLAAYEVKVGRKVPELA